MRVFSAALPAEFSGECARARAVFCWIARHKVYFIMYTPCSCVMSFFYCCTQHGVYRCLQFLLCSVRILLYFSFYGKNKLMFVFGATERSTDQFSQTFIHLSCLHSCPSRLRLADTSILPAVSFIPIQRPHFILHTSYDVFQRLPSRSTSTPLLA